MTAPDLAAIFARPPARPEPEGGVQLVAVGSIDLPPDRLRPVNPDWAAALAAQIEAGAALPPVLIRPCEADDGRDVRYRLVVGAHRLEAHRLAGRTAIPATVRAMTDPEARMAEIDENLVRHELTILDRAIFLPDALALGEELHPETKRGGDRKSRKINEDIKRQSLPFDFSTEAAERIGLSERSIRGAVALASALAPETIALARRTYLVDHGSDLAALARLRPDQQRAAVEAIAAGKARTLKESLVALGRGPTPADEQERLFQSFVSAWGRMNARTRKRVRVHIAAQAER